MKYTLNDIQGTSYVLDVSGKTLTLSGIADVFVGNVYSIINATTNTIMYQVNKVPAITSDGSVIDLVNLDLTGMSNTDELILILDMPLQKDVQVTNEVGVQINNGDSLLAELQNVNDTILEVMAELRMFSALRGDLATLRTSIINSITIASGTITTVTTVTTVSAVTNVVQLGGQAANPVVPAIQNLLVTQMINGNITFT